jgi:DNA-binding transcriptional regulator YiaG
MAKAKKIKVNIYDDMRRSLADALAYERGQEVDLRVTTIPAPPKRLKPQEIRHIRESLHASQAIFAHFLCVSPKAVQSWEQGSRRPQSTALRLLANCQEEPICSSVELIRWGSNVDLPKLLRYLLRSCCDLDLELRTGTAMYKSGPRHHAFATSLHLRRNLLCREQDT